MKIWLYPLSLLVVASSAQLALADPFPAASSTQPTADATLKTLSRRVVAILASNDTKALSHFVDPEWKLRFSTDIYPQKSDVKLSRPQVALLKSDRTRRIWGDYEGEGGPIRLNYAAYWKRFIWNRNFGSGAVIGSDPDATHGTIPNNLRGFFARSTPVEFYLPPTSKDKLDWASLWLVWRKRGATWRLIGIAHSEWTP